MKELLSYTELCKLIDDGVINADKANVNGSSIDITLAPIVKIEMPPSSTSAFIDIRDKSQSLAFREEDTSNEDSPVYLGPNEFCLASSVEVFNLPADISGEYKLKSTQARNALEHLNAGWGDPWWSNSQLTLEFKNMSQYHSLKLSAGMKAGQVVFFRHEPVPEEVGYSVRGQYNNQRGATEAGNLK